jgi:hypothetical protein
MRITEWWRELLQALVLLKVKVVSGASNDASISLVENSTSTHAQPDVDAIHAAEGARSARR